MLAAFSSSEARFNAKRISLTNLSSAASSWTFFPNSALAASIQGVLEVSKAISSDFIQTCFVTMNKKHNTRRLTLQKSSENKRGRSRSVSRTKTRGRGATATPLMNSRLIAKRDFAVPFLLAAHFHPPHSARRFLRKCAFSECKRLFPKDGNNLGSLLLHPLLFSSHYLRLSALRMYGR